MNMALIRPDDFLDEKKIVFKDRRHIHIRDILQLSEGDFLKAGVLNGKCWRAQIIEHNYDCTVLQLVKAEKMVASPAVDVILAMVRPRIVRQVLIHLASLGVRRIMFINAWKVPKPYFSQRIFDKDEYLEYLYLGLEQGCQTHLPEVTLHKRFNYFVQEEMENLIPINAEKFIAHPGRGNDRIEFGSERNHTVMALGPEAGWTIGEVEMIEKKGFQRISLGNRILRVETALPYLFGRLGL